MALLGRASLEGSPRRAELVVPGGMVLARAGTASDPNSDVASKQIVAGLSVSLGEGSLCRSAG